MSNIWYLGPMEERVEKRFEKRVWGNEGGNNRIKEKIT
jgi:hypothetical protein